jgi:hypothetical protein
MWKMGICLRQAGAEGSAVICGFVSWLFLRFLIGLSDSFPQSCGEKMALAKRLFMIVRIR